MCIVTQIVVLITQKFVFVLTKFGKSSKHLKHKIFKDFKSYTIFKNLLDEFGDTIENLANYSFIFHKMTYQGLIHHDLKQQSYYDFLSEFDIFIDRIKPLKNIGKIQLRESIYLKVKNTVS